MITPLKHIRTEILKLSQSEMATELSVDQSAISRWDSGETKPSFAQMEAIRKLAKKRGVPWNDSFFFATTTKNRSRRQ